MTLTRPLPTKAISIRQPWAWLIVHGLKDIENRTWVSGHRGPTLIHAAKGMTRWQYQEAMIFAINWCGFRGHFPRFEELQRGGVVGVVDMVACIPSTRRTSPWHIEGQNGFALRGAQPLPFTPLAGRLGFFDVSADVLDQIIRNQ